MPKYVLLILLFLTMTNCHNNGSKSAIKLYKTNLPKGTTLNQITKKYGPYSNSWKSSKNQQIYQYSFTQNKYDLISYLPIINHFGFIKSVNYEILLIFDNGKLLEQRKFFNKAKSANSLVCNPEIYSCIRKVSSKR